MKKQLKYQLQVIPKGKKCSVIKNNFLKWFEQETTTYGYRIVVEFGHRHFDIDARTMDSLGKKNFEGVMIEYKADPHSKRKQAQFLLTLGFERPEKDMTLLVEKHKDQLEFYFIRKPFAGKRIGSKSFRPSLAKRYQGSR